MKKSISSIYICLCVYLMQIYSALGQFPSRCTDRVSIMSRTCCPIGNDGSQCGAVSSRGVCANIPADLAEASINRSLPLLLDDRAWWPRAFYDLACFCFGNYDGVDCSECKPGYEGDDCSTKSPLKVRKNIKTLSREELEIFTQIIHRSKFTPSVNYVLLTTSYDKILEGEFPQFVDASIYDIFAWMHYYVNRKNQVFMDADLNRMAEINLTTNQEMRMQIARNLLNGSVIDDDLQSNADYAHQGPAFPPWHRFYLLKLEKEIRNYVAFDTNFALPYWDWRDETVCEPCNDFIFGASEPSPQNSMVLSSQSPFSQWPVICTRGDEYFASGQQCNGAAEGPIIRNPGVFDPNRIDGIPKSSEVDSVFLLSTLYDTPPYDRTSGLSFRNMLEGFANPITGAEDGRSHMHNAVHIWMNGTMSGVDRSANDPIFFAHHAFVDSLFETWIQRDSNLVRGGIFQDINGPDVGHRVIDYMVPFFPLVQNRKGFANSEGLGYVYDYLDARPSDSGLEVGEIVGIVIGSAAFAGLVVLIGFLVYFKCKKSKKKEQTNS